MDQDDYIYIIKLTILLTVLLHMLGSHHTRSEYFEVKVTDYIPLIACTNCSD